jgi:CDP-4-dehydro-6-deoxyglucose reductase
MPQINFEGRVYRLTENETVLDALLRHGASAAHSCKAGACHACLLRASSGTIPTAAQTGLKDSWKSQGYFLPCVCRPETDLTVAAVGSDARVGATITELRPLSRSVLHVRIECDAPLHHRAGQYVTLVRGDGLARSYSVASSHRQPHLDLHVRRNPMGRMSGWLHDQAQPGHRLSVIGPSGDCFYVPGKEDQPLLLIGTGTGLAPLYGILQDSLHHGHRGPIHLFHGAVIAADLYICEELAQTAARHPNIIYQPVVLQGPASDGIVVGSIDRVVLQALPNLKGWRAYICGDPDLVQSLRKKVFLAGAASREIFFDAFVPAA